MHGSDLARGREVTHVCQGEGPRGSQGAGVALEHPLCNLGASVPSGLPGNHPRLCTVCLPLPAQPLGARPGSPTSPATALPVVDGTQGDVALAPPLQSHRSAQAPSTQGTREGVRAGCGQGGHGRLWKCPSPSGGQYPLLTGDVGGQRAREREEFGVSSRTPKAKSRAVPKVQKITPRWKPWLCFRCPRGQVIRHSWKKALKTKACDPR